MTTENKTGAIDYSTLAKSAKRTRAVKTEMAGAVVFENVGDTYCGLPVKMGIIKTKHGECDKVEFSDGKMIIVSAGFKAFDWEGFIESAKPILIEFTKLTKEKNGYMKNFEIDILEV